ncbi:hypothetical protein LSH36_928g00007, partial [Paralvinella palmiformis]
LFGSFCCVFCLFYFVQGLQLVPTFAADLQKAGPHNPKIIYACELFLINRMVNNPLNSPLKYSLQIAEQNQEPNNRL